MPVTISRLTAQSLRSRWAVFDVLFRANATGTIAGCPFRIETNGDDLGRTTAWTADGLPVAVLASQIGGPFALLNDGTCDVQVQDRWRMAHDEHVIVMDWSLVLHQVRAEVPESFTPMQSLVAKPVAAFINAKGERVPLAFTLEMDESRFDGTASAEAAGLWRVVGDALAATLAKHTGINVDALKGAGGKAVEMGKEVLDKWRKKKTEP